MKALIIALVLAGSTAFAGDGPGMTVVPLKGSETFKVIYKGTASGKVKLSVIDAEGRTLHSETFAKVDGFILPVTFRGLESGKYTFQIVDHSGKYEEEVNYLPLADLKSIHVSKLTNEGGKFLLAIANAQNEVIQVRIYDKFHRLVFDESKVLSGDHAQVYRLDSPTHAYTFEVSDGAGNRKYFNF